MASGKETPETGQGEPTGNTPQETGKESPQEARTPRKKARSSLREGVHPKKTPIL